jgi:hypothetical protein
MEVTLHIPALFSEFPEINADEINHLKLPGLAKLFARSAAIETEDSSYEEWLYRQFTGDRCPADRIPYASLAASMDGLQGNQGWWMRADPVFLYPDTHSLIMQDPHTLNLTMRERDDLVDDLKPLFAEYEADFYAPTTQRWYLNFREHPPAIECTPLHEAVMKPVNNYLPTGEHGRRWHTLFNEIQMVLNQSTVNESREYHGQQTVNSLWFWGLGQLPQKKAAVFDCCIGGSDYVQSLCHHTSNRHKPLTDGIMVSRYQQNTLIVEDRLLHSRRLSHPDRWLETLEIIDQEIILPLLTGLKKGDIGSLQVVSDGRLNFHCTPAKFRSFWKRSRPLSNYLVQS